MALPSRNYRDPLEQLIEREAATCKGCAFQVVVFTIQTCSKQNQQHGRRCRHYTEKEGAHVQSHRKTDSTED
ncbi:hypothetical protein [Herbaspirillum huttiense]|uniref:hypothetical protein n=1 Tax=Herbaspirillum huttiense TaxID=863372 RepID=UPI003F2CD259